MAETKKSNGYWTKARCIEEALKYHARSEFKKHGRSAFASAQRNGWLDEICSHMSILKKPNGFWTKERCADEALKYTYKVDFQKGSNSAYGRAHREGWLEVICSHMKPVQSMNAFETIESCAEVATSYKSRSEFKKGCAKAYETARIKGWLDNICSHMPAQEVWDKEKCIQTALLYDSKKTFREENLASYNYAHKKGWLDEICQHMVVLRAPNGYWTKERCAEEAQKYKTFDEFETKAPQAACSVRKNSWQAEICSHLEYKNRPSGYWTKERCAEEALKYQTRTNFQINCESAYSKARKNNWLDDICGHMSQAIKPSGYWNQERCVSTAIQF